MADTQEISARSNLSQSAETYTLRKGMNLTVKTNIILLAVIAIALFAFAYQANLAFVRSFSSVMQDVAYLQGKTQTKLAKRQFEYIKGELDWLSKQRYVLNLLKTGSDSAPVSEELRQLISGFPAFVDAFYVVQTDGTILASSANYKAGETLFLNKERSYKGQSLIGNGIIKTKKGKNAFGIAALVSSFQEESSQLEELGYVVMVVELDSFTSYVSFREEKREEKKGTLAFIDSFVLNDDYQMFIEPEDPEIIKHAGLDLTSFNFAQPEFSMTTAQGSHLHVEKIDGTDWYLFTLISSELETLKAHEAQKILFISSVIIIAVLSLIISLFIRILFTNRILSLRTMVSLLAEGNLNLKFNRANGDELGLTFQQMRIYVTNLRNSIQQIITECNNANESSNDLGNNFNSFLDSLKIIIDQVSQTRTKIEQQNEYVNDTSSVVEELAQNISSLDLSIEKQSSSVEESSSSIEEMIGSIQSINRITEHAREAVEVLKGTSDAGKKNQQEVVAQIREIARNSEQLQEANTLIASIASQTNLLSMNAAIEASHAGDAGKGFAVVAEEIRDLAEQVTSQSESVAKTINEIMHSIEKAVSVADAAGFSFENILEKVNSVYQVMEEISHTMQEQSNGSKEILIALGAMRDISYEVKTSSSEMAQGNMQILGAIEGLRDTSLEVSSNADRINKILSKIDHASEKINSLRNQNRSNVHDILRLVKSFRL